MKNTMNYIVTGEVNGVEKQALVNAEDPIAAEKLFKYYFKLLKNEEAKITDIKLR